MVDVQHESLDAWEAVESAVDSDELGQVAPLAGVNHSGAASADATAVDFDEGVGTTDAVIAEQEVLEADDQPAGVWRVAIDVVVAVCVGGLEAGEVWTDEVETLLAEHVTAAGED